MSHPLARLTRALAHSPLDFVAVIPGSTLKYLTGLDFHLMERPIVGFFSAGKKPALVAPEFECTQIKNPDEWHLFPWTDEAGVDGAFAACCRELGVDGARVGVESLSMRVREYRLLRRFAPQSTLDSADALISDLRITKSPAEIEAMQAAVEMAEQVLRDTLPLITVGMTERELAAELQIRLFRAGSETLPFEPLVQTGITGASPHAAPGERRLAPGDLLIIDFGARVRGYVSDITRTFTVADINPEAEKIYRAVLAANRAGRDAAAPGIPAERVDRAARTAIEQAGYGAYFTHRTGHGVGLDAHEPPFMVAGDTTVLREGMAFTVEPGIYLPGLGGVRIEDDVVITAEGARSLTTFSRELTVVGA